MNKIFLTEEMFGVKLVCKSSHQILFRTQKEAAGDSQLVWERRGGSTAQPRPAMVPVSPLLLLAACPLLSSVTFLRPGEAELVAAEGGEAVMECGVTNLASNHLVSGEGEARPCWGLVKLDDNHDCVVQVSWLRSGSSVEVVSVGELVFSSDSRLHVSIQSDKVDEENENTCLVWQFQITIVLSHFSVCCRYQNMLC